MLWPKLNKKNFYLFLAILGAFLTALCLFGYKIAPDAHAYINSSTAVSPLYCLLIDLFQWIFGDLHFIVPLIIFQNILVAYAIFSLVSFVVDVLGFRVAHAYVIASGFFLLFVLQTVFTVQGRIPSNTILSEAIAFPLYFLFFKYIFASVLYLRRSYLAVAWMLSFLLVNTRGQLAWLLVLMIGLTAYAGIKRSHSTISNKKSRIQFFCGAMLVLSAFLCASFLLPRVYNQYKSGQFTGNTLGRAVVLTSVMYVSDAEDVRLFTNDMTKFEMFESVYRLMDEEKRQASYAPRGVLNRFYHYEMNCDAIQAQIRQNISHLETMMSDHEINVKLNQMIVTLGNDNLSMYLRHYATNAFGGFVRSVALLNKPFTMVALAQYLLVISVMIAFRKNPLIAGIKAFLALCLVCIALNVLFTSFGVWCLSRYMFYNFPLFYMGMYLTAVFSYNAFREKIRLTQSRIPNSMR